jgi:pimeloyl-ACP methyl ester carboxylesterase
MLTRLQTVRAATLATISSPRFIELALAKLFSPQDVPEGYQEHLGVRAAYRERTFRAHMLQASGLSDSLRKMMPHYDGIKLPVEIIHGSDDTIIKCDEHAVWASERLPNAKLTVLPGIGHMPHHTSVDEVADRVIRMSRG